MLIIALASSGVAGAQALGVSAVGESLKAAVQTFGAPLRVASADDGNHVIFANGAATIDALIDGEAGQVHALDVRAAAPATFALTIDGTPHTFAFGTLDLATADATLTAAADYSSGLQRSYRVSPTRELVLIFDPKTQRLARLIAGEGVAIARLGLLPAAFDASTFVYTAPVLAHSARTDGSGSAFTIVRIDVDKTGVVRNVAVTVPSGDTAFDAALVTALSDDTYAPAKIGDRAIAGSVFREIRH
jgi:TonB family protein